MNEISTYTCTMCGYQGEFEIEGSHEIECGGCHHTICLFKVDAVAVQIIERILDAEPTPEPED